MNEIRKICIIFAVIILTSINIAAAIPHSLYPTFASHESRMSFSSSSNILSVSDTVIYKTGYYSINGSAWTAFNMTGNSYANSQAWLGSNAQATLPNLFNIGDEHYIIIYSCNRVGNTWDCHPKDNSTSGFWQLYVYNNSVSAPLEPLTVTVTASSFQNTSTAFHPPQHAYDNDTNTRWTSQGSSEWIQFAFSRPIGLDAITITFLSGSSRTYYLSISVSDDGSTWIEVFDGQSSMQETQTFSFPATNKSYLRIIGGGNSVNNFNNYVEVRFPQIISASCNDGLKNGDETGVDCGGPCSACECNASEVRSCSVTNGVGQETRSCTLGQYGDWSSCTLVSCSAGYLNISNTCYDEDYVCYTVSDCDDNNSCTIDSCSAGVCTNAAIDDCNGSISNASFANTTSMFYASFEQGSAKADVGSTISGGTGYGELNVVDNPAPSVINPTSKVMKANISVPGYKARAEYQAMRVPTNEHTHIYAWKEYFPSDFFEGRNISWLFTSQWKTWRCEKMPLNEPYLIFADTICSGAGIFNDLAVKVDTQEQRFQFRAEPDCDAYYAPLDLGVWQAYVLEIYWTNTSNGYYNIYKNGELIYSQSQVQTLMDGFLEGECNIFWTLGLYSAWKSDGATSIDYYFDDMAVFDEETGVTVEDVLAWQGFD